MKDMSQVNVQLCETDQSFNNVHASFCHRAVGAFIIFDLTRRSSFEVLQHWVNLVKEQASKYCQIVILGNKADLLQPNEATDLRASP